MSLSSQFFLTEWPLPCYSFIMSPERRLNPKPGEIFEFTKREQLNYRVSDARFRAFIDDEQTRVHSVQADSNIYGEFLFVTVSRTVSDQTASVSFLGLGYHDYRERWFTEEWVWYENHPASSVLRQTLDKDEAKALIQKRRDQIHPYVTDAQQSARAKLFETIADFTDDDAAYSELGDLGEFADWLPDDFD